MKKIIILGAGIGGLTIASLLDNKKYKIEVYEKKKNFNELGYFWKDDVNLTHLKSIGFKFTVDSEEEKWNINTNTGEKTSFISDKEKIAPIDRKYLSETLFKLANNNAKINFNSDAEIKDEILKINDKIIEDYDLIIDSRGCINSYNKQIFNTKRIIINKPSKEISRNIFLKPCNINGVAWCNFSENNIDILIGQIGFLEEDTIKKVLKFIENKMKIECNLNEIDKIIYNIPVRYPSVMLFKDKYVMLGDIANMTIPIIGSGINNTMEASYILANLLNKANIIDNNILWEYQYEYFQSKSIASIQIDIFKNWLLSTKESNIDYLFSKGVINSKDLENVMNGNFIDYDIKSLKEKIKKLYKNKSLMIELGFILYKAILAKRIVKKMPKEYNENAINNWKKGLIKILKY